MRTPIIPLETVMALDAKMFYRAPDLVQAWDEFAVVLEACGWDERDYNRLVLNRINGGWD